MAPSRSQPMPPVVPVTAHEWRWLALAVVLGAAIRLMYLDRVAVEHFDEGVYAANVWFGAEEGYQYPLRQFYAPPLLPALIEWCYVVWGFTGMKAPAWLPMVPSLLCGIATIPSAWWIARRWFGPAAGYAVMWLVALNEFHAAYSRTALTDVPVTLAILWAVFAAWKLLLDPTVKNGVVTGGLTAVAWWLKYSGWLPLAILIVGGAVFQCLVRPEERRWKAWGLATAIAVFTAGVLWLPVLSDCQAVGGYSAVAANHRGYIMGWSHWWANFWQIVPIYATYHMVSTMSWVVLLFMLGTPHNGRVWSWRLQFQVLLFGLPVALALAFEPSGIWLVTLLAATAGIIVAVRRRMAAQSDRSRVGSDALAATWFCGLIVATPLYQPYPRLIMPWWMATVILTARAMADLYAYICTVNGEPQRPSELYEFPPPRSKLHPGREFAIACFILAYVVLASLQSRVWEDRDNFRRASLAIANEMQPQSDTAIAQVYGLPPVVLALRERGVAAVVCGGPEAAARLDGSWVIVSSDADRDSTWNDHWPKVADQFELIRTIQVQPSSIVRLDNGPMPTDPPPVEVRVYRHR